MPTNWALDALGVLSLKVVKQFYSSNMESFGLGKVIWLDLLSP